MSDSGEESLLNPDLMRPPVPLSREREEEKGEGGR